MKNKIISIIFCVLILSTSVLIVTGKTTNDEKTISTSSSEDVVLSIDDISDIKDVKDNLENPNEKEALQAVIDFVEKEGQITMEELEILLDSYGIKRIYLSGKIENLPNKVKIIMTGTWIPADKVKLLSGEVNSKEAPPSRTVSWTLFLGYYNVHDISPLRLLMTGFAFGLNIDNYYNQALMKNLFHNNLMFLFQALFNHMHEKHLKN